MCYGHDQSGYRLGSVYGPTGYRIGSVIFMTVTRRYKPFGCIKFKMADSSCSENESESEGSASDDDENVGPLEEAAQAGADLQIPGKADISRKRKIQRNPGNVKRSKRGSKDPKLVSAWERVKQYKNEHLTVVNGKLRCDACKEIILKKKSSIKKHVLTKKHLTGKKTIEASKIRQQSIVDILRRNDARVHPKGETLPNEMRLFPYDLVEMCLKAGIPIAKIDCMRPFLEKYGHCLTSSGHLSETIPLVLEREKEILKTDISIANEFSVVFDGSSRLWEVLAIVLCYIDTQWKIQQRLLKLETLEKSLKSQELAQRLIQCLAVEFSICSEMIISATKDGAAVNEAALNQVKFYFPNIFSITCFSHVIDNAGKKFQFRILDTFLSHWNSMFSQSPAVRLAWKIKTGKAMRTVSATRWWSKWEVVNQVCDYFGDVDPFLREIEDLAPALRAHLLEIFDNPEDVTELKLEIAALIDGGRSFFTTTYNLEGDGPLIFTCYQHLTALAQAVQLGVYPNCTALSHERANGNQVLFNQFLERAKSCIKPGFQYYLDKVNIQFYDIIQAFRGARLCCPVQIQGLQPTIESLELLRKFPFLDDDAIINGLAEELPNYLALSDGVQVQTEDEKVKWWARNAETLLKWAAVVRNILLVQPSSGAAERVFSLLNSNFSKGQEAALEETVEASIMVKYNSTQREKAG